MKASVDQEKCQGHLRCAIYAEQVFEVDEFGHAFVQLDNIPSDLEEDTLRAATNCPEGAIVITK